MSNEFDELRHIAAKVESIEQRVSRMAEQRSAIDFGLFIVAVLLALILWRVW